MTSQDDRRRRAQQELADLDALLLARGLARCDVPKDGSCAFRALSDAVYGCQSRHAELRALCVAFLRSRRAEYEPFVDGVSWERYLFELAMPGTWAGNIELQALSRALDIGVTVWTSTGETKVAEASEGRPVACLAFSGGNHFDVVWAERRLRAARVVQSLVFEVVNRAVGEPAGAGTEYRNVAVDVWLRELREQHRADKMLARTERRREGWRHGMAGPGEGEEDPVPSEAYGGRGKHRKGKAARAPTRPLSPRRQRDDAPVPAPVNVAAASAGAPAKSWAAVAVAPRPRPASASPAGAKSAEGESAAKTEAQATEAAQDATSAAPQAARTESTAQAAAAPKTRLHIVRSHAAEGSEPHTPPTAPAEPLPSPAAAEAAAAAPAPVTVAAVAQPQQPEAPPAIVAAPQTEPQAPIAAKPHKAPAGPKWGPAGSLANALKKQAQAQPRPAQTPQRPPNQPTATTKQPPKPRRQAAPDDDDGSERRGAGCSDGSAGSADELLCGPGPSPSPSSADDDVFAAISAGPDRVGTFVKRAKRGLDLSRARNAEGDTPLAVAIRSNSTDTVRILLEADVSTNSAGLRKPFLTLAAEQRNVDIVRLLIKYASEIGDYKCFHLILSKCDRDQIEAKTTDRGETPLHLAVRGGSTAIVHALIANKAPLHAIELIKGSTPLHVACRKGLLDIARSLMDAGAPVNATDFDGNTVVHEAARSANLAVVREVASRGAVLQARNCDGNTVLHIAVLSQMPVRDLLELASVLPGDLSVRNRVQLTPVEMAKEVYISAYEALLSCQPKSSPAPKREFCMHFTSDIHLEFGRMPEISTSAPYLALLGDTSLLVQRGDVDHIQRYRELLAKLSTSFKRIFIVLGNHEFYHNEYMRAIETLRAIASEIPNVEVMHRRSVVVDGVRVVGATLWCALPPRAQRVVPLFFNDYKLINRGDRLLSVADTVGFHVDDRAFIAKEILAARACGQKVVVLTHHAPLWRCGAGPAEAYYDPITHATAGDVTDLMGGPVVAWLYGHSHWFQDMTIKGTRVASNPHGYPQDGIIYDPRFSISFPVD
eukprot:m51a1_g4948 hypothetical protein (1055) ;mRNA; f:328354-333058